MLVQVQRGQVAPQVLPSNPQSPDQVSPPRADEPLAKAGAGTAIAVEPGLDAEKTAALNTVVADKTPTPPVPPVVIPPPVIDNPQPTPTPEPQLPERGIVWGRWQQVAEFYAQVDFLTEKAKNELLGVDGYYVLFRTPGQDYVIPNNGNIGFALTDSSALIYTDYGYGNRTFKQGTLTNGSLTVDFGARTFLTSMDLLDANQVVKLQAQGGVTTDGRFYSDQANGRIGYMNLQGLLSKDKGGSAAYIFDAKLDDLRTVNGAAYWSQLAR
jgi:hypothetical protein